VIGRQVTRARDPRAEVEKIFGEIWIPQAAGV
jgi:orotidine-5'-phosphate decarboxylase